MITLLGRRLLDTPPEERFDRITRLVAAHFGVPSVAINFVDATRQWTKSGLGETNSNVARDISFCAHAILEQEALVVYDTIDDARFRDNPLVSHEPHLRFYAGVPLRSPEGYALGTLCIADTQPRWLSAEQLTQLRDFAALAEHELNAVQLDELLLRQQLSEARFRSAAEGNLDAFFLLETVRDMRGNIANFRFVYANQRTEGLLRIPRTAIIGRTLYEIFHSHDTADFLDKYVRVLETGEPLEEEFPVDIPAISATWLRQQVVPAGDGLAITARDISARKQSEADLREANARLTEVVRELEQRAFTIALLHQLSDLLHACESLDDAVAVIAMAAQALFPQASGILYAPAGKTLAAPRITARWGANPPDPFHPCVCRAVCDQSVLSASTADCPHCSQQISPPADTLCIPLRWQSEVMGLLQLVCGDGASLCDPSQRMLATMLADQVALALSNLSLRDVLRQQALRDPLTGLYNRRHLDAALARELERTAEHQTPLSLIIADIDHFKRINDTWGHAAGDAVLQMVAQALSHQVRSTDVVCRMGGEEFVLVLPDTPLEVASRRAERVRALLESTCALQDPPVGRVTVSLGVAAAPAHGQTSGALLAAADAALYRAKAAGRNRVERAEDVSPGTAGP
jgi:diguanylate cyclase (GGDEF)-like protein